MKLGFIDSFKRFFIFDYRLSDSGSLYLRRVSSKWWINPSIFMIPNLLYEEMFSECL